MAKEITKVNGSVTAPAQSRPTAPNLPKGRIEIKIIAVEHENPEHPPEMSDHWEILCLYPDGFKKSHQIRKTADLEHLLERIRAQLKGRYGCENAGNIVGKIISALDDLGGRSITFEGGSNGQ